MEARCKVCGKAYTINKAHKDYKRIAANRDAVYICQFCGNHLAMHALKNAGMIKKEKIIKHNIRPKKPQSP